MAQGGVVVQLIYYFTLIQKYTSNLQNFFSAQ